MRGLGKLLSKIDIFGMSTNFRIKKSQKFKTVSGGMFTLLYLASLVALICLLGEDIVFHKNPNIGFAQILTQNGAQTNVSRDSYFFMFGLQDANANHFIDPQIYNITIHNGVRNTASGPTQKIPIPVEPCTNEHLPDDPDLQSYFTQLAGGASMLQNVYCIKKGLDNEFALKGEWDEISFNYIQIKIYSCANGTDVVCKDNQTIQNALKQGFFGFYSTDYLFDMNDYENPAKRYGLDYFIPTSLQVPKSIIRYVKTNRVESDLGWFINDVHQEVYFSHDSDIESFTLLDTYTPGQKFAEMQIRKQHYEYIYSRNYKKIKTLAAEVSGFLRLIILFLSWFSRPFIKSEYYDSIANQIFNFEVEQAIRKDQDKISKRTQTLKGMIHSEQLPSFSPTSKKKAGEKLYNSVMQMRETPIQIGFWESLKSKLHIIPEIETKKKQKAKGVRTIFAQLDICNVLHKFMEIEKLKALLLTEDQRKLFDYLPKPIILKNLKIDMNYESLEKSPKKTSFYDEEDLIERTKVVRKAYHSICRKTVLTSIDQKLIEMLDKTTKNLFHIENQYLGFETPTNQKPSEIAILGGFTLKLKEGESLASEPVGEERADLNQVKIWNMSEQNQKDV